MKSQHLSLYLVLAVILMAMPILAEEAVTMPAPERATDPATDTTTSLPEETPVVEPPTVDVPEPPTVDGPTIKITEFSDFQCPFCQKFHKETLPQLKEKYGDRLKITYKHFPLPFHQYAQKAAEASECARDQNKFSEYHDALFDNSPALDTASLEKYADKLGLDVPAFKTCLESGEKAEVVKRDHEEGLKKGVSGTPTFFMNGKALVGAQPLSSFIDFINENGMPESTTTPTAVQEQVKCVFANSNTIQTCYASDYVGQNSCSGVETCTVDITGVKGQKLTWKSSCGGYDYTVIDGDSESAQFTCLSETEVTEEAISGKGFRFAHWQCYNEDEQNQGGETSCKSSETWQSYAHEFCQDKCYPDNSKCGVNSFSVANECYLEYTAEEAVFIPSVEEEEETSQEIETSEEEIIICKDSCPLDRKCYPFGYRKDGNFCSDEGSFVKQLEGDLTCENNFECSSNVCVDGTCVSSGLIEKIMDFFRKLFV